MKNLLKQLMVLTLVVCCLLTFVGCSNPANEFAGEYERLLYEVSIVDMNGEIAPDELKSDANLTKAINDIIVMVGTKAKLTAKYILFRDSNTKFNIASYELGKPVEPELQIPENNTGIYEITTNDEQFVIRISAYKVDGSNTMTVNIRNYAIALDGKDYQYNILIAFKIEKTR